MQLHEAQAGHAAMRAQLVRVMSQTDGTEQPDVILEAYDRTLRHLIEAEQRNVLMTMASPVRDRIKATKEARRA